MKECIGLTTFAISSDETRYVLNGALMLVSKKDLKLIATDGRRLAFIQKKGLELGKEVEINVIIPTKALHELNKNIQGDGTIVGTSGDNPYGGIIVPTRYVSAGRELPETTDPVGALKGAYVDWCTYLGALTYLYTDGDVKGDFLQVFRESPSLYRQSLAEIQAAWKAAQQPTDQ